MGLNLPHKSSMQPLGRSAPRSNTYEAREVNIGRVEGRISGGPAVSGAVGEGLQGLARGLNAWADVLEQQERQKQTFEAMDQINQARDRQRAMLDQMEQMKGRDGITAPYLMEQFYEDERKTLEGEAKGDFQKMIYTRFLDSERDQGLNKAMAHRTAELDNYEKSVMAGDQAQFEAIAADWRSTPDDITAAGIPFVQRQAAYLQSKGLDPRAAAHESNKLYRQALLTNATNHVIGLMDTNPDEAQRVITGAPQSSRLPANVSALADKVGAAKGVDPALLKAIIMAESSGQAGAVSKVGARGLMQLMPGTARDLGVNPDDPEQNVQGGAEYISRMLKQYNGNLKHALMAYNWGPGNLDRWLQKGGKGAVPQETREYVRKVMADYNLQKGGGRQSGGGYVSPVNYTRISSRFSPARKGPVDGVVRPHTGVDLAAPAGTPVNPVSGGVVDTVASDKTNGNFIVIKHDDGTYTSSYSHLQGFAAGLKKGDRVEPGMVIGYVGSTGRSTGPHLHLGIRENGERIDPVSFLGLDEKGGQAGGQPVMLANNTLGRAGDVVSDAYGMGSPNGDGASNDGSAVGAPINNVEAAVGMAMPSAEIDPNSPNDWLLSDYAAIINELASPGQKVQLQAELNKRQAAALKAQEAEIKRLGVEAQKEMTDLWYEGALTEEELQARRDLLSPGDYDKYKARVRDGISPPSHSSRESLIEARERANRRDPDYQGWLDEEFRSFRMTPSDYSSYSSLGEKSRAPVYKQAEQVIKLKTGRSEMNPNPAADLSYLSAVQDFDDWLDSEAGQKASDRERLEMANRIGDNYRLVDLENNLLGVPAPLFLSGSRTAPDIQATIAATNAARAAGQLSEEQYLEEARRIARIKKIVDAHAAAAPNEPTKRNSR